MLKAVVVCAALFTAPSWYASLVLHETPTQPVLTRFVIAMPVAYVLLLILRTVSTADPATERAADPARVAHELATMEQQLQPAPALPAPQPGAEFGQRTTTENNPVP